MSEPSLEEMANYLDERKSKIITEWKERGQTINEASQEYDMLDSIEKAIRELAEIYESVKRNMVKHGYVQE